MFDFRFKGSVRFMFFKSVLKNTENTVLVSMSMFVYSFLKLFFILKNKRNKENIENRFTSLFLVLKKHREHKKR